MAEQGVSEFDKQLEYDLRMIYAVHIVGRQLIEVKLTRDVNNYPEYFRKLKHLYIVIRHKIKNKKIDNKKATEVYKELVEDVIEFANKYDSVWFGRAKDNEGCSHIEEALNELEVFLYDMMEEAKMFGGSNRVYGL